MQKHVEFLWEKAPQIDVVNFRVIFATYGVVPLDPIYLERIVIHVIFFDSDGSISVWIWVFRYPIFLIRFSSQQLDAGIKNISYKTTRSIKYVDGRIEKILQGIHDHAGVALN